MDPLFLLPLQHYGSCLEREGDGPRSTGRRCGGSPLAERRKRRIESLTEVSTSEEPKLPHGPEMAGLLPAGAATVLTVPDSFALDPTGMGPGVKGINRESPRKRKLTPGD